MLRNQAGFTAGKAQTLSLTQATADAAMAAARAGTSQAYTIFRSAAHGIAGYKEQMSQIGTRRSMRQAFIANEGEERCAVNWSERMSQRHCRRFGPFHLPHNEYRKRLA